MRMRALLAAFIIAPAFAVASGADGGAEASAAAGPMAAISVLTASPSRSVKRRANS